mmetsp:Transcript_124389/g.265061  ORF Transcript_124389/g.265061 Transcript_124389/m.265061 type:complete len:487 (-) Transcript_124389:131-1591(-)
MAPPNMAYDGNRWDTASTLSDAAGSYGGNDTDLYDTLGRNDGVYYDALGRSDTTAIEIALDPELLTIFCRRGRRRLRDIQMSCQAAVKLDRARGVLRVSGPESSIHAVRRSLASLTGPRRPVPAAVWAELMRTRTMNYSAQATIARLQQESGCRIHIERSRQEVRIFGPGGGIALANKLLDELAKTCTEEVVSLGSLPPVAPEMLQTLARACCVTLRVEEGQIAVLGVRVAVDNAVKELKRCIADPQNFEPGPLPREVSEAVALEDTEGIGDKLDAEDDFGPDENEKLGAVTTKMPPPAMADKNLDEQGLQQIKCGHNHQSGCRACPTCGAGRFCVFCGAPTWQVSSMNVANYAAFGSPQGVGGDGCHDAAPAPRGGGAWKGGNKPGTRTPDSDSQNPPWVQGVQFMQYDGGMGGMVPAGMVPVCFPTGMVANGMPQGGMQVCMMPAAAMNQMSPACMMAPGDQGAMRYVPGPYLIQDGATAPVSM